MTPGVTDTGKRFLNSERSEKRVSILRDATRRFPFFFFRSARSFGDSFGISVIFRVTENDKVGIYKIAPNDVKFSYTILQGSRAIERVKS